MRLATFARRVPIEMESVRLPGASQFAQQIASLGRFDVGLRISKWARSCAEIVISAPDRALQVG